MLVKNSLSRVQALNSVAGLSALQKETRFCYCFPPHVIKRRNSFISFDAVRKKPKGPFTFLQLA